MSSRTTVLHLKSRHQTPSHVLFLQHLPGISHFHALHVSLCPLSVNVVRREVRLRTHCSAADVGCSSPAGKRRRLCGTTLPSLLLRRQPPALMGACFWALLCAVGLFVFSTERHCLKAVACVGSLTAGGVSLQRCPSLSTWVFSLRVNVRIDVLMPTTQPAGIR